MERNTFLGRNPVSMNCTNTASSSASWYVFCCIEMEVNCFHVWSKRNILVRGQKSGKWGFSRWLWQVMPADIWIDESMETKRLGHVVAISFEAPSNQSSDINRKVSVIFLEETAVCNEVRFLLVAGYAAFHTIFTKKLPLTPFNRTRTKVGDPHGTAVCRVQQN